MPALTNGDYMPVFRQHPGAPLREVCRFLDDEQHQHLLRDILADRVDPLKEWILRDRDPLEVLLQKPPGDLAFDDVMRHCDRRLLDYFSFVFEDVYGESLAYRRRYPDREPPIALARVKALVSHTGVGVHPEFLHGLLADAGALPIQEEVDIYLLLAKSEEHRGEPDLEAWRQRITQEKLRAHPHLVVPLVYVFRKISLEAVSEALSDLERSGYAHRDEAPAEISEPLLEYLGTYLRHAFYLHLPAADDVRFEQFFNWVQDLQSAWLRELVLDTLEHPALDKVLARYYEREDEMLRRLEAGDPFHTDRLRAKLDLLNENLK